LCSYSARYTAGQAGTNFTTEGTEDAETKPEGKRYPPLRGRDSGGFVVRRAVVNAVMMMVMVRRGKRRSGEREYAAEENKLLHGYQNGMNKCGLSLEI
jgi:hypothetical protein